MSVFRKLTEEEQKALGLANLDVLLSSRASEETLAALSGLVSKDSTLEELGEILTEININTSEITNPESETNEKLGSVDFNTDDTRKTLQLMAEQLEDIKNLLKLILS